MFLLIAASHVVHQCIFVRSVTVCELLCVSDYGGKLNGGGGNPGIIAVSLHNSIYSRGHVCMYVCTL